MIPLYKVLSYISVAPFFCAALGLFLFDEVLGHILLAFLFLYAGFYASFHSGIHWAHALGQHGEGQLLLCMLPIILSVILSGWGFVLLTSGMLMSIYGHILLSAALALYSALYTSIWIMDAQWLDRSKLPEGYMRVRALVTLIIFASLVMSIVFLWV